MSIPKKPLFIPLKREWFEKFERGEKDTEYRPPNWYRLAPVGRSVVLSLGYGKGRRITGEVVAVNMIWTHEAPAGARGIYGRKYDHLTAIKIELDERGEP